LSDLIELILKLSLSSFASYNQKLLQIGAEHVSKYYDPHLEKRSKNHFKTFGGHLDHCDFVR